MGSKVWHLYVTRCFYGENYFIMSPKLYYGEYFLVTLSVYDSVILIATKNKAKVIVTLALIGTFPHFVDVFTEKNTRRMGGKTEKRERRRESTRKEEGEAGEGDLLTYPQLLVPHFMVHIQV